MCGWYLILVVQFPMLLFDLIGLDFVVASNDHLGAHLLKKKPLDLKKRLNHLEKVPFVQNFNRKISNLTDYCTFI